MFKVGDRVRVPPKLLPKGHPERAGRVVETFDRPRRKQFVCTVVFEKTPHEPSVVTTRCLEFAPP